MSRYANKVKVVNPDKLCFPADVLTLEPAGCGVYDTHPLDEPEAHEVITTAEWNLRRAAMREVERRKTPNAAISGPRSGSAA